MQVPKVHYLYKSTAGDTIKIIYVEWVRLDDSDTWACTHLTWFLIEYEVNAGQLITVDVPSKSWSKIKINHENRLMKVFINRHLNQLTLEQGPRKSM